MAILYGGFYLSMIATLSWVDGYDNVDFSEPFSRYKTICAYWFEYRDRLDGELSQQIFIPLGAGGVLAIVLIFLLRAPLVELSLFKKKETIHGDASWATEGDIKRMKLRAKKGVLLGNTSKGYLVGDDFQHALLFAPTGSGKGVGFVIPNLLFWQDSLVVHDIKLENYELTSGYRQEVMKQKVYLWNPASPDGVTHCYNALDWVSRKPGQMVDDIQKISNLLCPEQEFWENEARSLFVGIALYLVSDPDKPASLGEVVRTLRSDDVVYNLAVVLDTLGDVIHPVSYMNIAAFLQKADKERSGVMSTLNSKMELWTNPLIDAATSTSDFDFNKFKYEPITVYVGLTPDNIDRLKPLMQIFYQQAAQILTKHTPRPEEKVGVMFMLDEFPTLGELSIFKQGIAYFRGYNVKLFLIIQDTEQLKDIYEEAGMNSFLANSTYRITFAANTVETAKLISELIGNKTVKQYSRNSPVFLDLNPSSRSKTLSEAQRALLLPQEVIGLPRDEQIILIESSPPIKTKKIFYYKDKFFTSRLLPEIHVPTQEPYDPKKLAREEEERKKKEEEEKKKEEEIKRKAAEERRKEEEAKRKAAQEKKEIAEAKQHSENQKQNSQEQVVKINAPTNNQQQNNQPQNPQKQQNKESQDENSGRPNPNVV